MLEQVALLLAAAVIAVPIARRLGLGSVLGYLIAGIAIGPWGAGLIDDVEDILRLSEFGIVLLLFVIGLELQPSRLWRLRHAVFGMGGAQVLSTSLVLGGVALLLGAPPGVALIAGFGLAMSSTAFVLQMLAEKSELTTHHGRAAFAILLFQDLAVIPFIALLPLLAGSPGVATNPWLAAAQGLLILALVIAAGRYALRPVFRVLAATRIPEVFTAAALLTVLATALAMEHAGLSMSLGAFLAGVLLADSEYRHELQADIEPFKGLLLGLFFIAVGMSANLGVLAVEPLQVLLLVTLLVTLKALVLYALGRAFRLPENSSRALAVAASQGGEFAFVLFGLAAGAQLLPPETRDLLVVSVTLSMMLTPPLYALQAWLGRRQFFGPAGRAPEYDRIDAAANPVIVAGFGPFGQIVGRILRVRRIGFTVLEKNPEQVETVRRFGSRIFYGDAARLDLLKAARADTARCFILTMPDVEVSLHIAESVRKHFPHLRIFAVAKDRNHALRLMDLGIRDVIRRSYFSSLEMTRWLLQALGDDEARARESVDKFRQFDEATLLRQQAVFRDETKLVQSAQDAARELEQLFEADRPAPDSSGGARPGATA